MATQIDASLGNDPYYQTGSEYYGGDVPTQKYGSKQTQGGGGSGLGQTGTFTNVGAVVGSFWGPVGTAVGGLVGGLVDSKVSGGPTTTVKRREFNQTAIDKTIYDIMSSDKGLAALAGGENLSGGYGSSTKSLMAQDLTAKVAGEVAAVIAPEVTETKKKGTVICTELVRQNLLERELYDSGHSYFLLLHPQTVRGYQVWATRIAAKMSLPEGQWLCKLTLPIARKRYLHITHEKFSLTGALTVWIAEPICYLIGFFVPPIQDRARKEKSHG